MNRRQVLAAAGMVAVAGCLETTSDDPERGPSGRDTTAPSGDGDESEGGNSNTGGSADDGEVATSVWDAELATREVGNSTELAVTGQVENTGTARLASVTATGKFYNGNDQLLTTAAWHIRDFAPGEIWEPWLAYRGDGEVDWAEIAVTQSVAYGREVSPDGLKLADSDLQIPADTYSAPRVVGEVANHSGESVAYLDARPKIYANNGSLLATGIKSVQNLGAGDTWQFDIQLSFNNVSWKDRISDYDVVLARSSL